jgi:hypothetical protein
MAAVRVIVLLILDEEEDVTVTRLDRETVGENLATLAEALMVKDCVGDPVEVRLERGEIVLLPEPVAVFDDVIDDVCVLLAATERVVDGDADVVFDDVIERD